MTIRVTYVPSTSMSVVTDLVVNNGSTHEESKNVVV
jgi:hypothetical protein